jgi:hypothetical protein
MKQEEPKQIKCYCGHTITCDCEPKQETGKEFYESADKVITVKRQETLEEAAEKYASISFNKQDLYDGFIAGAKWQQERMYTYDELRQIAYNAYCKGQLDEPTEGKFNLWIQQFKKK